MGRCKTKTKLKEKMENKLKNKHLKKFYLNKNISKILVHGERFLCLPVLLVFD